MDETALHERVKRFSQLKKRKTAIDKEMSEIRSELIQYCEERNATEWTSGRYRIKLIYQERKEYDDQKLYEALPDPDLWRMISKADTAKIAGMQKMNMLNDDILADTFTLKRISLLQVDKK